MREIKVGDRVEVIWYDARGTVARVEYNHGYGKWMAMVNLDHNAITYVGLNELRLLRITTGPRQI